MLRLFETSVWETPGLMSEIRWRWILALAMGLLTPALLWVGDWQEKRHFAELQSKDAGSAMAATAYDYSPPAYLAAATISFPAFVLAAPAAVIRIRPIRRILTLLIVALFWYWLGRQIDYKTENLPPRKPVLPKWAGIGLGGVILTASVVMIVALVQLPSLGFLWRSLDILWCTGIGWEAFVRVRARWEWD